MSPRSRPTAAWPATGSAPCAAGSRRSARRAATMRAERERSALPTVALAGYTNAGKSTLLNALTGAGVGVGDRLFHTLDPTTRAYEHDGRRYLLTDTVGFIRKLPHQLVDAFKATLEETMLADLIVHVVDASDTPEDRAAPIAAVDVGARGDRRRRSAAAASSTTSSTCSTTRSARSCWSASARRSASRPRPERASRSCSTRSRSPSRRRCGRWSCSSPTTPASALSELHALAGKIEREDTARRRPGRRQVPAALAHRFEPYRVERRRDGRQRRDRPAPAARPSERRWCRARARFPGPAAERHRAPAQPRPSRRRRARPLRRRGGAIEPGERAMVGTGIAIEIPDGLRRRSCCRAAATPPGTGSRWSTPRA